MMTVKKFKKIPVADLSYNECLKAVMDCPATLEFIPEEYKTEELCRIAVVKDVSTIKQFRKN